MIPGCIPGAPLHCAGTTPFMLSVLDDLPAIVTMPGGAPGGSGDSYLIVL
jgi:hypothetical protein